MATPGVSAFQMFKDKCEARQKQKQNNVVSFIKSETIKKKQQRADRKKQREDEEKGQENKKRRRRGNRKTREEKEALRQEKLDSSIKKSMAVQKANGNLELKKKSLKLQAKGAFLDRAQQKMNKGVSKRKRDDSEDEGEMTNNTLSDMETIFGKCVDKVKPGIYQHSRIMITSEKMESIMESSKAQKTAKKKRKREREALKKLDDRGDQEPTVSSEPKKGILKKASQVTKTEEVKETQPKVRKASTIPGWRRLAPDADSEAEGQSAFEWLISPVEPSKFFTKLWEKKPMLVKRKERDYNTGWFSTSELDLIMRRNSLLFGENIDVVTYSRSGKRETHNPEGRAHASVVWDFYQQGCSVRLLNPQTYSNRCWKMLSTLQEFFGCLVGANVYLTPPGSQGFAPHWDDIEAFVLQLEGKKRWRLYEPKSVAETLPRVSSPNLEQTDLGECILDTVLEPGDLLYFPRGVIHQADTQDDNHSLHITVSTYQKTSWADLMEKLIPQTLAMAIEEDVEFRKGLPVGYLNHLGICNQELEGSEQRQVFLKTVAGLFDKLKSAALVDAAVDQMAKDFLHDSLPPSVSDEEAGRSCRGAGEHWRADEGRVAGVVELQPDTEVKLMRKRVARLIMENDAVWVFYAAENKRLYHARDPMCFEIPAEQAENVEALMHAYPSSLKVEDLPAGSLEEKLTTVNALYDRGLVMTSETLDTNWMYSDDDISDEDMDQLDKVMVVGQEGNEDNESDSGEESDRESVDSDGPPEPVVIS